MSTHIQSPVPAVPDSTPSMVEVARSQDQAQNGVPKDNRGRAPRQQRPNYALIHAKPLPYEVFPLPAFIPHNPLSVVRIAIAMLSRSVWKPTPKVVKHNGCLSVETQSVHVTDAASIRALWEQGFWGSGSLSRSEPRWLDLEKRKRGLKAMQTSEEVTQQRRRERRQFKLERARLEREAIEEQRRAEAEAKRLEAEELAKAKIAEAKLIEAEKLAKVPQYVWNAARLPVMSAEPAGHEKENLKPSPTYVWNAARLPFMGPEPEEVEDTPSDAVIDAIPDVEDLEPADLTAALPLEPTSIQTKDEDEKAEAEDVVVSMEEPEIQDQEHLQLTFEEAFFLSYVLGVLDVYTSDQEIMSNHALFRTFSAKSTFPDNALNSSTSPDTPFLLHYVVFHHFRSLGWVVRSGVKFAVDFLLYNRGPAFSHAEFAVMVLPEYSHPYWSETEERKQECKRKADRDWWWLHRVNRVQGLAHKTLMLVYVEVPPPYLNSKEVEEGKFDIGSALKKYKVREFVIGRWTPNRHR